MAIQPSTSWLVSVDLLVDRLVANPNPFFYQQSARYLLWTPIHLQ